jgi:predicted alpha-1,2-mannosidase
MPTAPRRLTAAALAAALLLVIVAPAGALPRLPLRVQGPAASVDPFMGTMGAGFVFPGPAAPFGMVQLSPDTNGFLAYTGYQYIDPFIRGFSHVHISGMGVPATGNVPFMPTTGAITSTDVERYQSPYTHLDEEAEPGYYRVRLLSSGIDAELTAGTRVGMHRYTFPPTATRGNVLLDIGRQIPGGSDLPPLNRTPGTYPARIELLPDQRTVVGTANHTLDGPHRYPVHFAARFDAPLAGFGTWDARGAEAVEGATAVEGDGAGAYVSFDAREHPTVTVKVGISFTGVEGALANLEAELPGDDFDFDALRARTFDAWEEALSVVQVEGGTPADRTAFYSMLYRTHHHPNVFSDADGAYLGHDGQVHHVGQGVMRRAEHYYANFSLWDTYRGQMPLLMLLAPDRVEDMIRSLAAIGEQGDRLPRWGMMNRSPDYMAGEPAVIVAADAWCRGLVPPDVEESLYRSALHVTVDDHRHPVYTELGWVPHERSSRSVTDTLEHAISEFSLALVADRRGRVADRDLMLERAGSWRGTFDADDTRFARPRHADGTFVSPWQPTTEDGFQEGTSWQYTWLVPHDVRALFDAIGAEPGGGDRDVVERLDRFFKPALTGTLPVVWPEVQQKLTLYGIAYFTDQYPPSNQHALHTPYLYAWAGQPWKSQAIARGYQGLYRPVPDGIPGNDDLGTLSAWYVWSALGLYPAVSGAPLYVLGSPVFERAEVALRDGGTFTVEAPGASYLGRYVQSAAVDGVEHDRAWVRHDVLADGGTLRLDMGLLPNRSWAAAPEAAPPSLTDDGIAAFGCRR